MCLDGAANLCFLQDIFVYGTDSSSQSHLNCVAKFNMFVARCAVNPCNGVAFIQLPLTRQQEQIITRLDGNCFPFYDAGFLFDIHLDFCAEAFFVGD